MQYKHILRQRITTGAASLCGQHSCTLAKQQKYHQNVYLTALHKTALGLMNHLDLTDLLQTIIKMACELIGTTHGCISLVDTEKEILECKVALGFYTQHIGNSVVENQGVIGKVWKTRSPLTINDYPAWAHHLPDKFNQLQAVVGVPLLSNNMVVGVIALAHIETNRNFNEKNMEVLHQFAQLASIALDNARLYTAAQHELAERQKAEEALRKSQSKNRALLNVIPDLIYRIDKSGVILDFRGAKHLLVLPPEKILCKNIREVWPQTLSQQAMYYIKRVIDASAPQVFEYQIQLNSSMVHQEARIVLSGEDEVLVILRDITKRKQLETKLTYLSLHDQITGLYNRTHFEHSLRQMQASSYFPFSIVVCDVDGLKLVNDTLGHDAGDTLLKTAADILKQCFRTKDLVARIGGDEFAILLPNSLKAPVETACRRIRDAITEYNKQTPKLFLSMSIGFASSGETTKSIRELFKQADNNMYREKLHRSQSARGAIFLAMMKAMETRDFIADGHAERLQKLLVALASTIDINEHASTDLCLLAKFHDIGKVGIPDSILFKPTPLTDEERSEMQRHCEIGYRIAQSTPDLLPIADWILKHHEWWNGNGYPLGLKGEEIPRECRILAIADAYDAMTNDRPYRKAISHTAAIAEIKKLSGEQFDPKLVKEFIYLNS